MFKKLYHRYSPIGLDLGRTALRAVQLCRSGTGLQIESALEVRLERCGDWYSLPDNDQENNDAYLINQIKHLMDRGGFMGRRVALNCPADKLDMRPVVLPADADGLERDAVLGVLRLKMADHLAFPLEQAVFDYFILDNNTSHNQSTIMALTADGAWIKHIMQLVSSAGLHCERMDAHPCVLARLAPVITKPADDNYIEQDTCQDDNVSTPNNYSVLTAMLDIGYSGSTLVVAKDNKPVFCRRFALGGQELTEALSQRIMVDLQQAENLKIAYGLDCQSRRLRFADQSEGRVAEAAIIDAEEADSDVADFEPDSVGQPELAKTIYAALQKDLNDFVQGLTRSLNYVISEQNGARLEKILLCGSASHTRNLDNFLGQEFSLPVDVFSHSLLEEITKYLPATRSHSGTWGTALGLALTEEQI